MAPPPSSLGSLGVPASPSVSVRLEGERVCLLPQEAESKEEEAPDGSTEDSASCYVKEVESGRDRTYMQSVQNLQVVLHGRSDPGLGVSLTKPLHTSLAFAKVAAVMRPRQPPSARRVIVSALPDVAGMAQVSELHPVLVSHAITEANKMLKAKVRLLCEICFDLVWCLNQAVVTAE